MAAGIGRDTDRGTGTVARSTLIAWAQDPDGHLIQVVQSTDGADA